MRTLVAALLLSSILAAPAAAPAATWQPPKVTVVTDSAGDVLTTVPAARAILTAGLDVAVDTRVCRKLAASGCYAGGGAAPPPSVLDAVKALGPALGAIVVVEVGYNDLAEDYAAGLDQVMAALDAAGVKHVIWVTLHESQPTWARINDVIRAAPARWPTLAVADWAPLTVGRADWYVDDPHMNDAGGIALATFLHGRILDVCGPACVPPEAIATLRPAVVRAHVATVRWTGNDAAAAYDVALRRSRGAWRVVARGVTSTSYRVRGTAGALVQVRVRARDGRGVAGRWSQPATLRL